MEKFIFNETFIKDLLVIDVTAFDDSRGCFMETYQKKVFYDAGIKCEFVQDNQSTSVKGVLRGLHFQKHFLQAKLVRVVKGSIFDVVVDLRSGSNTYGRWYGIVLSEENHKQLFIPKGFAHGFLVLSDFAEFVYKCDDYYHQNDEGGIIWNDPSINIQWPNLKGLIISEKDNRLPFFDKTLMRFDV